MDYLLIAVLVLDLIAFIASLVLYACSRKFYVKEDNRISVVSELLPHANCGGCGYPGCSGFASAVVRAADAGSIDGLSCPVGGNETMKRIADVLNVTISTATPKVAIIRCGGTHEVRPEVSQYSGLRTCFAVNMCSAGETACGYGCLGCGDCVKACKFGALSVNPKTGIAEVDNSKCVGCGACVNECPRNVIELRDRDEIKPCVYIRCMNCDSGSVASKACGVSCIGCGKCAKECPLGAITIDRGLAHIDTEKCDACGKCVTVCPRHAIGMIIRDNGACS